MKRMLVFTAAMMIVGGCAAIRDTRMGKVDGTAPSPGAAASETFRVAELTGRIETMGGDEVYLVTNWTTRSKKTYEITSEREKFRALSGKVITAKCEIYEEKSWAGKIRIKEFRDGD